MSIPNRKVYYSAKAWC